MKYGQHYFKNRKAVSQIQRMVKENMVTIQEATRLGITKSKIVRWEKEGKITSIEQYGSNRRLYNRKILIELELSK